jgi:hypothetical protein
MAEAKLHVVETAAPKDTLISQHCAIVMSVNERGCQVAIGTESFQARVAFSCLVKPEAGDVVLAVVSQEKVYITSILERRSSAMILEAPGDVLLAAPRGTVHIAAAKQLTLDGGRAIECSAEKSSEYFSEKHITASTLKVNAGGLDVSGDTVALSATRAISTSDDLYVHTQQSVRTIENTEITKAGSSLQDYDSLLRMHAKTASITTDDDIKIDGRLIHMG